MNMSEVKEVLAPLNEIEGALEISKVIYKDIERNNEKLARPFYLCSFKTKSTDDLVGVAQAIEKILKEATTKTAAELYMATNDRCIYVHLEIEVNK